MGLAERFKEKIEKTDIFTKNNKATSPFVDSKELTQNNDIKSKKESIAIINAVMDIMKEDAITTHTRYQFEDVEDKIIDKIRKTPYWSEYSIQRQESMIDSYINKRKLIKDKDITKIERKELINNILVLSNKQ